MRNYDRNYYLDNQERIQDKQRDYYRFMPPDMKAAYLEVNRKRAREWYKKKHPNAKTRGVKQPKPIKYIIKYEVKDVMVRWD